MTGVTVTEVSFFAYGNPSPQGSKRFVGHGVMVEASKTLPAWRDTVIGYARKAYDGPPLDGALELDVVFWFPRPTGTRRGARYKTTAPDLDKLIRALGDALQIAGTIRSDATIARLTAAKRLTFDDDYGRQAAIGADITISRLDNGERKPRP